jgi:hypothetical protein
MDSLSEEEREAARRVFGDGSQVCSFCGGFHLRACPRVAEFELYEAHGEVAGSIKRVRFWAAGEWDERCVVWPEAMAEGEEESNGS